MEAKKTRKKKKTTRKTSAEINAKFKSYVTSGTYHLSTTNDEICEVPSRVFYKTYEEALSQMVKFAISILLKGYPDRYEKYYIPMEWFALTPEDCVCMLNTAFEEGLITSCGKNYANASDAWGDRPDKLTAEVPDSDLYIDIRIDERCDKKRFENRCEYCLWLTKWRGMPWCNKANKACKNVVSCPESVW